MGGQTLCPQINQTLPSALGTLKTWLTPYRAEAAMVTFLPRTWHPAQRHRHFVSTLTCCLAWRGQLLFKAAWNHASTQAGQVKEVLLEISAAEGRLGFLSYPGIANLRASPGPCTSWLQVTWVLDSQVACLFTRRATYLVRNTEQEESLKHPPSSWCLVRAATTPAFVNWVVTVSAVGVKISRWGPTYSEEGEKERNAWAESGRTSAWKW